MNPRLDQRDQQRALSRTFLTRFFDNDITGGSNDLKTTYFWLVGFLTAPGFLVPILMMWQWGTVARFQGIHALRQLALTDKTTYLSLSMVATGVLAAITWNSLLLDRRDALILGGLPVRGPTIVRAKLLALAAYMGLLSIAMHGPASVTFGVLLASENTFTFLLRGIVAHFLASTSANVFVLLIITSAQGVALGLFGPRLFTRLSPILQVGLIASILLALTFMPALASSARDTMAGTGSRNHPWMLMTPPFLFLGVYEWLLGTTTPVVMALQLRAMSGLALLALVTLFVYPIAYRRLAASAVEGGDASLPGRRTAAFGEMLVTRLARHPTSRAAVQFFMASLARVERLRFVVAIAAGLIVGWSGPVLYYWATYSATERPLAGLLALSFADVAFLLVGLRVVAAMPSDLKAAWIVAAADASIAHLRSGLWRAMFAIGVVPVAATFACICAWFGGGAFALRHSLVLLASGALLVELLLWNYEEMPCAKPWRPEHASVGKRWPLYLVGFIAFSTGLPEIEVRLLDHPLLLGTFVVLIAGTTVAIRLAHQRRLVLPPDDADILGAPAVLRLD